MEDIILASFAIGFQWRVVVLDNMVSNVSRRMSPPMRNGCGCFFGLCALGIFFIFLPFFICKTSLIKGIIAISVGMLGVNTVLAIFERICGIPGNFPMRETTKKSSLKMQMWCLPIIADRSKFNKILSFYFIYPWLSIFFAAYLIYSLW